ncbi:MAG TPA: hypothetical protein VK850_06850 [Candidatus Binatia bacterium]|nr:hypothetical protein [Candidatus Binatia bacterium]
MATISNNAAFIVPPAPATTASATNDIRGVKPPVEVPNDLAWIFWLLGIALGLAAAYIAWRHWRKKRVHKLIVPPAPPHVRARQRLHAALAHIHDPRQFCSEVSDALRIYLEERFRFHAPERTTEEFLVELHNTNILTLQQKQSLADFLQSCDLVKFARHEPTEGALRDLHDSALRLVDETQHDRIHAEGATVNA